LLLETPKPGKDTILDGDRGRTTELFGWTRNILDFVDFIIITGNDSPDHRREAMRLGAKNYFVKPFPLQDLLIAIQEIQANRKKKE
jgi:DNA-binding NtrC family response regulator